MKRTVTSDKVTFELRPYRTLQPAEESALEDAAKQSGDFLDRTAVLDVH
jgi:hypothetical protein